MDLVISSFVLQLVPDRAAALREAFRVLRPGGVLAALTWLDGGDAFLPSAEFDEAVMDLGIPEPGEEDEEDRAGDFASPQGGGRRVPTGGLRAGRARARRPSSYAWDADSYLEYKRRYDEAWLFELLEGTPHADRLAALARGRFAALPPEPSRGGRRSCPWCATAARRSGPLDQTRNTAPRRGRQSAQPR